MPNKLEQAARQALDACEAGNKIAKLMAQLSAKLGHGDLAAEFLEDGIFERTDAALREALAEQAECKECGAKQAQIDRLMLEYCPDEMTHEQMLEWGNNQRPVEQAEQSSDSERMEPVAWHEPNAYGNVTTHKKWAEENGWLPLYTKE